MRNNPLRFTDPSGHYEFEEEPDDKYFTPPTGREPARRGKTSSLELSTTPPWTEEERALARMMWGEERSLGEDAMIAAGWVAVNRLNAGWGDTLLEVLTQPNQFQGYSDTDPSPDDPEHNLFLEALEYARGILNYASGIVLDSRYADPTAGALFFGNGYYGDENDYVYSQMVGWDEAEEGFTWGWIDSTDPNVPDFFYSNRDYTRPLP